MLLYRPRVGCHDLAVDAAAMPRPGWEGLLTELSRHRGDDLERRQRAADRLVLAEGAGYLLHEGLDDVVQPWRVSVVPVLLRPDVWADLAAGLAQRAELMRAVLRDLAGPRELLRSGVVPVEAVAAHPGYLHLRHDLLLAGADVVVDAEGAFRVVRDHTDVADGDGLALLARSITNRVAFDGRAVVAHDAYLRALRTELAARAPGDRPSPRTVVLSGGVDEQGYVENAYLATLLGYSLAEVADLTVRRGRVWLRSLDGPEPVDVVLRRVATADLDPVEDPGTSGGVAGIVHAARAGVVHLANPAGAEVGGHLALLPFLDAACRHLLGAPLRLPSLPTLWCGDPDHRAELRAAPQRFVLYDTDPADPAPPAVGAQLDGPGLADWLARIAERPERYVAQVEPALGTTPQLLAGRLTPAAISLRTQVLLGDQRTLVFPGGHGRLLEPGAGPLVAASGAAADVRVLGGRDRSDAPAPTRVLPQVDLRRSLPIHAAEAMYWIGRSAERAETGARTALVCLTRIATGDPAHTDLVAAVDGLRAVSGGMGGPGVEPTVFDLDAEVRAALAGRTASVVENLLATVRNARAARQLLSARTWRLLIMLEAEAASLAKLTTEPGLTSFDATEVLDRVLVPLAALSGLVDESVVRGPGWRFLDIGRRLERALLVLGLTEALLDGGVLQLEALLAACESLAAYRRSFRSDVTAPRRRRPAAGRSHQPALGALPARPAGRRPQRPTRPPRPAPAARRPASRRPGPRTPCTAGRHHRAGARRAWTPAGHRPDHGQRLVRRTAPEVELTCRPTASRTAPPTTTASPSRSATRSPTWCPGPCPIRPCAAPRSTSSPPRPSCAPSRTRSATTSPTSPWRSPTPGSS